MSFVHSNPMQSSTGLKVADPLDLPVDIDIQPLQYDMILDAARGIAFMHNKGYMHCDIKSPNFLVTSDRRLKLSDLGESRKITGPPKTMSPPRPAINW